MMRTTCSILPTVDGASGAAWASVDGASGPACASVEVPASSPVVREPSRTEASCSGASELAPPHPKLAAVADRRKANPADRRSMGGPFVADWARPTPSQGACHGALLSIPASPGRESGTPPGRDRQWGTCRRPGGPVCVPLAAETRPEISEPVLQRDLGPEREEHAPLAEGGVHAQRRVERGAR